MPTRRTKTLMIRDQFKSAYDNGQTLRQIGDFHKVSPGTVRNALLDLGVTLRNRGRRATTVEESHDGDYSQTL